MSEICFQQVLVRIVTDADFRHSLLAGDPESTRQSGLSPAELTRIRDIDPERLELFAEMVTGRRINDAMERLPLTSRLLGERLQALALEFFSESNGEFEKREHIALAFARFLQNRFRGEPAIPEYVKDVLLYELVALELFDQFKPSESAEIEEGLQAELLDQNLLQAVPFQLPNIRAVSFQSDILNLIKSIREDRPFPATPVQPTHLIILMNGIGTIQQSKVNFPTLAFFETCDGTKTVGTIVADLCSRFQQDDSAMPTLQRDCIALCRALTKRRLIGLDLSSSDPS